MAEMEDKLGAILSNPQLMQQIMSMAQSLGGGQQDPPARNNPVHGQDASSLPDPAMLQALSGLASGAGTDSQQQALLSALSPYLNHDRISRLEKAMRAAKMARLASSFLSSGVLQSLTSR